MRSPGRDRTPEFSSCSLFGPPHATARGLGRGPFLNQRIAGAQSRGVCPEKQRGFWTHFRIISRPAQAHQ